jgi:hypothetical protein
LAVCAVNVLMRVITGMPSAAAVPILQLGDETGRALKVGLDHQHKIIPADFGELGLRCAATRD